MPTREELDLRDRAERSARAGRHAEALAGWLRLLARTQQVEPGAYDGWLEGALAAYRALGRRREAGYVLLALGRFGEAEASFDPAREALDWALAVARQGRHGDAARALDEAGHPALAAIEYGAAGRHDAARLAWDNLIRKLGSRGLRYEEALARFNLATTLAALGDATGARRSFAACQVMLEELADDFESRGERERAFDCYGILIRIGRDTGSFENVSEGYLNSIRILEADDQKFYVLQYYEDFIDFAVEQNEWLAAAALAREAADFSLRTGLVYDRHYLRRAVDLSLRSAHHNREAGGPVDLSENALGAAIDAAASLGDLPTVTQLYLELSTWPGLEAKRGRYESLARRHAGAAAERRPITAFPEHLKRPGAYQDVWRQDLIEWELDGVAAHVLARVVVDRRDFPRFSRLALRALLLVADPAFRASDGESAAELARALGRIQVYETLRPLERLYGESSPEVREAVMAGVGMVFAKRSFGLVRRGLADPAPKVRLKSLEALRALKFRDAFDPLVRIFRDFKEDQIRVTALETLAGIGSIEAGLFLIEVLRHETGAVADKAQECLKRFVGDDITPFVRQELELASPDERAVWQGILGGLVG